MLEKQRESILNGDTKASVISDLKNRKTKKNNCQNKCFLLEIHET